MDSNGLNFWMLSSAADWLPPGGSDSLYYCTSTGRLQLRSRRTGSPPVEDPGIAADLVATTPMSKDAFGTYARWDPASGSILAGGGGAGETAIYKPPAGQTVSDLAMGYDGALYAAVDGALILIDRRNRWPDFTLADPSFKFWRLTALPDGGVLALDKTTPQLGFVAGLPLQVEPADAPDLGILRSCQANPNPPQVVARYALPGGEKFVAFTAMGPGQFCLISWASNAAYLWLYSRATGLTNPYRLTEVVLPYAVAWLGEQRLAVLATNLNEALIFDLQGSPPALAPAGDTYILAGVDSGPFVHSLDSKVYYARGTAIFPLLPLSLNSLATSGATQPFAPKVIDSGSSQTIWHRLYLEAIVPPRCGIVVSLAASDNPAAFTSWYAHGFGSVDSSFTTDTPRAAWIPVESEVAFAKPMLGAEPIADRQGLFMVLIQRAATAVRNLTGRYLAIHVQLNGGGRDTPEIAALRVHGSRYSYVSHYLPELYRENKFGADADGKGESTRRDFFERFVNIFEAQMTRIEDRVGNAYLLTRPESAPDEALDWLGGWVGLDPAGYPPDRRRARLLAAPDLYRERGTAAGITRAVDVATNGLCTRGAVFVIENFRMRHIFATILGADLAITTDPLLPGYNASSNSFVGGTLFLGDPRNPDFLSLFATAMELPSQQADVQEFLDSLAYRLTIFVHNQVEPVDLNLVRQIVAQEKPAHVMATIQTATQPFLIGLASLLGANSYLAGEPAPDPAVVDVSMVGRYNLIQHVPSLDPRWENGESHAV